MPGTSKRDANAHVRRRRSARRPDAALRRRGWSIKPAGKLWKDLVFRTWWTDQSGKTAPRGRFATRPFLARYRITAGQAKPPQASTVVLDRQGATVPVRLGEGAP